MPCCEIESALKKINLNIFCRALLPVLLLFSSCKSRPVELWHFSTKAPVYASPVVMDGKLIVGSQDHFLYALDLQSGKQLWKTDLQKGIFSKPLVIQDSLYIGGGDGRFYKISANNGEIKWGVQTADVINYEACSDNSGIYFGSSDASFYKIDFTGNKLWNFKGKMKFWGHCIIYNNVVITSAWDNYYAFDRMNGELKWKVNSGTYNYGGPALHGDHVYFATHDQLFRIEAETGKVISNTKTTYLNHLLFWDGFLWTNEDGLKRRRVDGSVDAFVKFKTDTGFRPVSANGYLILAGGSNELIGVSKDLQILWKYKGDDKFWAPGIVVNGIYYTGNRDHNIYAIQLPAN